MDEITQNQSKKVSTLDDIATCQWSMNVHTFEWMMFYHYNTLQIPPARCLCTVAVMFQWSHSPVLKVYCCNTKAVQQQYSLSGNSDLPLKLYYCSPASVKQ